MKHPFIAAATALALVIGLTGAVSASPISFPPEISTPDDSGTSTPSDGSGAGEKKD